MTLEQAVEILNKHKHHGHSDWYIPGGCTPEDSVVYSLDQYDNLEAFDAIAVAEKLERDGATVRRATTEQS